MLERTRIGARGTARARGRSSWAVLLAVVTVGSGLGGFVGVAVGSPGVDLHHRPSPPPYAFASVPRPIAVAVTPSVLLALSSKSCSTVYAINATGGVSTFATLVPQGRRCPNEAIAISPGLGNFTAGSVFVLQGDSLFEIPANGSSSPIAPTLTIPDLRGGRVGLTFDEYGAFGFSLLAVGGHRGDVAALTSPGTVINVGAFRKSVGGPSVAPLDFGSVGGDLVVVRAGHPSVLAMTPNGTVHPFSDSKGPKVISFVPSLACSYSTTGDSYFVADTSANEILAVPSATFVNLSGQGLLLGEWHGEGVDALHANGSTSPLIPLKGSFSGAAYVNCPAGVAKRIDLTQHGFGGAEMNVIGFDPATGELIGADPTNAPSEVFRLNGSTGALLGTVNVRADPSAVAFDGATNQLFIADSGSNNVTVLNASTYGLLETVAAGLDPVGLADDPVNDTLYIADGANQTLIVYPLTDNPGLGESFTVPVAGDSVGIVYDPVDDGVYAPGIDDGYGEMSEVRGLEWRATVGLPAEPGGVAVNSTSGLIYVTMTNLSELDVYTPGDHFSGSVGVGAAPVGVAFDPSDGFVFVENFADGSLSVVDGAAVVDTFVVGTDPGSLVYDPVDHLVYVAADVTVSGFDPRIILGNTGG